MTMKEFLHEGVPVKIPLKLNTPQIFFIYVFSLNIYLHRAHPTLL